MFQEIYRLRRYILERHLRKTNHPRWWVNSQEQVERRRAMTFLLLVISAVVSLLFLAFLALAMIRKVRNAHDDIRLPMRDGARVLTTITDVQIGQGWKVGERWERNSWDGSLVKQKTWQTYYDVTAKWVDAQTKQSYFFHSKVWSDEVAKKPTTGQTVVFIADMRHSHRSAVDVQSFS